MGGLGEYGCTAACGVLFLGTGGLLAIPVLRPEEIRVIHENKEKIFPALGAIALLVFLLLGTQVSFTTSIFWLLGAVLGAVGAFELGRMARIPQKIRNF